jgi:hypothetical protein
MVKIHIKVDQKWNFTKKFEKFIYLENKIKKYTKHQNLCVWKLNKKRNKMSDWQNVWPKNLQMLTTPSLCKCPLTSSFVNYM